MRNKSRPKGSIVEGYLAEESMTFCSRYLGGIETRFNRVWRNFDGGNVESSKKLSIFKQIGCVLGKATPQELSKEDLSKAHLYVLNNCDEVHPFIE